VLVGLAHRPSTGQRAADLRGFTRDMNADIESCAGGVGESLTALRAIQSGTSHEHPDRHQDRQGRRGQLLAGQQRTARGPDAVSGDGVAASFRLARVVDGLLTWAVPDAQRVQTNVANVLTARGPQARARATAALRQAQAKLDAQRSVVDSVIESASTALSAHATPPRLCPADSRSLAKE